MTSRNSELLDKLAQRRQQMEGSDSEDAGVDQSHVVSPRMLLSQPPAIVKELPLPLPPHKTPPKLPERKFSHLPYYPQHNDLAVPTMFVDLLTQNEQQSSLAPILRIDVPIPPTLWKSETSRLNDLGIHPTFMSATKHETPLDPPPPEQRPCPTFPELNSHTESTQPTSLSPLDAVDKSQWTALALKRHPEIIELMERIRPLSRATSFAAMHHAGKTEVRETLTTEHVTRLILQHLENVGYTHAKHVLEHESGMQLPPEEIPSQSDSLLMHVLRMAIRDVEQLYTLINTSAKCPIANQTTQDWCEADLQLSEHLLSLGIAWGPETTTDNQRTMTETDIYDEVTNETNILFTDTGEIKAATLNQLILKLTTDDSKDSSLHLKFLKTFLLTYRSFTTPEILLEKLMQRYAVPIPEGVNMPDFLKNVQQPIRLRVCNVIKQWVERYFFDFNDSLISKLNSFLDMDVAIDMTNMAKIIRNAIEKQRRMAVYSDEETLLLTLKTPPPEAKVPRNIFSPQLQWVDIDEEEIARQLTLIEFKSYTAIKPLELLNQAWNNAKYKHRSPNVLQLIARFNAISLWVTRTIMAEEKIKVRARMMQKFIKLGDHLKSLNNFNTLMAILAGLNDSCVHRLKWTKSEMASKWIHLYDDMQALMTSEGNHKMYRMALHQVNPPCIPYLGVYLTDLTFIEDGNRDEMNGLINMFKRSLVSNVIMEVQQYQQQPYNLQTVVQIQDLFNTWPSFTHLQREELTKAMYADSLRYEPRGAERSTIQ